MSASYETDKALTRLQTAIELLSNKRALRKDCQQTPLTTFFFSVGQNITEARDV